MNELPGSPTPARTFEELFQQLSRFTDEQRSLAWSPQPPFVSTGAHDCRIGGGGGLDFNYETPRARWIQARFRWNRSGEATLKGEHES